MKKIDLFKKSDENEEKSVSNSDNPKNISEPKAKKVSVTFDALLSECQEFISKKYAAALYDSKKEDMVKSYIKQFIVDRNYFVVGMETSAAVEKLFVEMAEYSLLTPFLKSKDVEEININSWNDIAIHPANGRPYKLNEHFRSPSHAMDIMRRLFHKNKIVFDESNTIATGYLGTNIRVTALHPQIVGDDSGVSASIRLVNPRKISRNEFISNGTCTNEMYDFLLDMLIYEISAVIAGGTGSGKTTLMADIMSYYPDDKRIFTIEKSVREFNLRKYDDKGRVVNNVVHTVTRDSDDPNKVVSIEKLLVSALTMHPVLLCVAEMKDAEAWFAQEAARTGHTVWTTVHAGNIRGIYTRLVTLCLQKHSQLPFNIIEQMVCEAFPLAVYQKYCSDGKRRVTQIAECVYEKGECKLNPLWSWETHSERKINASNVDGYYVDVKGDFRKCGTISENLQTRLIENGMPIDVLQKYL